MIVTDANKVILRVNQAFTRITGYSADDVIGRTPDLLKSGRQKEEFYIAMWESIKDRGSWEGEVWNRRKNGDVYPEQLTITAVKDATGVIANYVGTFTDITTSKAATEAIKTLAFYDPLSQLPNRRLLIDRLTHAMATNKRSNTYGALMFLDLDNFKPVNDTHGHVVGDALLIEAAQRLTNCIREMDTVARFGGDEFVVMLQELDVDKVASIAQATAVAEKIQVVLSDPYVLTISPELTVEHRCTVSIGVVMFISHEAGQDDLMRCADIAMYQAKDAGRNQIAFYKEQD
jgi:diguanylate cyclase (GGDEF)-like protein/PAS domain S-box-containing protein